jgi:polyisoprenoid-binding protein YceI
MPQRYRLDPEHSRFTVQAFAAGLLAFVGHSPTFAVRDFSGQVQLMPDSLTESRVEVAARAASLQLLDRASAHDRAEIEERMQREVLAVNAFPEIRFHSTAVAAEPQGEDQYLLRIGGQLTLRGVTNPLQIGLVLQLYSDGLRAMGQFPLRMSAYRIAPITALGGAIRLKDQLQVSCDFAAWKEEP